MESFITDKYDAECASINSSLATKLLNLREEQIIKQTHFFEGRYENIYVDQEQFPELQQIIRQARLYAAEILHKQPATLKIGCWINIMHQGHTTTLHRHDDDDELLSGVYYLLVPKNSGNFVFHHAGEQKDIVPIAGHFLFFAPSLNHEVTEHLSPEPRISIAFNIGPIDSEEDS